MEERNRSQSPAFRRDGKPFLFPSSPNVFSTEILNFQVYFNGFSLFSSFSMDGAGWCNAQGKSKFPTTEKRKTPV